MSRRVFRLREGVPLLNIVSYGRGGLRENGGRLMPEQIHHIRRTVQRVPEVMVKVLPRASNDLKAAGKHLDYISRYGQLPLEGDDGGPVKVWQGSAILEEWDLDIDDVRRQAALTGGPGKKPPKLVHKLMFSMPAGTPPDKMHAAVRNFAREQFWGQHRYAMALHTDEDHPHVHLVLKAVSEGGARLNIRKAMLRYWRSEFARNLRLLDVPANATERAVRGETKQAWKDGIYRAGLRGDSIYLRERAESIAFEMSKGHLSFEPHKSTLVRNLKEIARGWRATSHILANEGHRALATQIVRFVAQMPPAETLKEQLANELYRIAHRLKQEERSKAPSLADDHVR